MITASVGRVAPVDAAERHASSQASAAQRKHRHVRAHLRNTAHRTHRRKRRRGPAGVRRPTPLPSGRTVLSASAPPLVFGVYPGGAAGAVGLSGPLHPEDPVERLSALEQLRPAGKPFVVRLYAEYTGPGGFSAAAQVGREVAQYTANGFQIELVLCYRPGDNKASAVPGFVDFARNTVDQLGRNRGVVSLQVSNEANVSGAPNAADGYYAGAKLALIKGVEGAKAEIDRDGLSQLKVGFSWAYQVGPAENKFWGYLGKHGGSAFVRALDWVGIDAYPGTWGPALRTNVELSGGVRQATLDALSSLRKAYMPLAHIPRTVPIHVSESGYPTGPGRAHERQSAVLQAAVRAVSDHRATYNVTDYRWFDLRDANSSSSSFEDQYGLMTDTYQPKPAFGAYRTLVSAL
jgi:hypothetical protein